MVTSEATVLSKPTVSSMEKSYQGSFIRKLNVLFVLRDGNDHLHSTLINIIGSNNPHLPAVGCCCAGGLALPALGRVLGAMEVCIGRPSPCGAFTALLLGRSLGATEVPPITFA